MAQWIEVSLESEEGCNVFCCHRCTGQTLLNHHERLFFCGKHHRHFLFNYVRMSLLLLAVYMGVFIIQFGTSVLKHYNPETDEDENMIITNLSSPIIFFIISLLPVIFHDAILPDIVAKIVQTTKVEQMIDQKHVQRVVGMMKARNALMVLHNMSSFMHHIDEAASTAMMTAKNVLRQMPGLESLNDISINELLSHSQPKTFLKGSTIIASGELSTSMYIVITGNVGKTRGGKSTTIIEAGSFFGATAMITGETCTSDYIAIAPKVLLFQLEHDTAKNHLPVDTWNRLQRTANAVRNGDDLINHHLEMKTPSKKNEDTNDRGHLRIGTRQNRDESITTILELDQVNLPTKRKPRHRHLKSAQEMLRELAMRSTFNSIDKDGGGTISIEELKNFFSHLFPVDHPYHLFHVDQIRILGLELDLNGKSISF